MTLPNCYRCGKQPCECKDGITLYHADCRDVLPLLEAGSVDLVLTDPPYGIGYETCWNRNGQEDRPRSILNDDSVQVRDSVLAMLHIPSIVFGSWKREKPEGTVMTLTWEKTGSSGMGDLKMPWRPNTEEIYIIGKAWVQVAGRESSVVRFNALCGKQRHPNEKPIELLGYLITRMREGTIIDPFMGSGTTLQAAKDLGRKAIGIELEEKYCEIATERLRQEVLFQ